MSSSGGQSFTRNDTSTSAGLFVRRIDIELFAILDFVGQAGRTRRGFGGVRFFGGWQAPLMDGATGSQVHDAHSGTDAWAWLDASGTTRSTARIYLRNPGSACGELRIAADESQKTRLAVGIIGHGERRPVLAGRSHELFDRLHTRQQLSAEVGVE